MFPLEGPCLNPHILSPVPCPRAEQTPRLRAFPRGHGPAFFFRAIRESFSGGGHFTCGVHCIQRAVLCSVAGSEAARMGRRVLGRGLEPAGLDLSPILSCDRPRVLARVIKPRTPTLEMIACELRQ